MPVLSCQKNGKPGHKWGKAGVCFTGSDSRERALSVGRAIAAQRAREMKEALQQKDQSLGTDTVGGFLIPDAAEAKLLADGLGINELTPEILGALTKDELNAVHDRMHEVFTQFVESKGADTDEGSFTQEDFDSAHQLLEAEFTNRGMKFPVEDEITVATKKAGQSGQAGVVLDKDDQPASKERTMIVVEKRFPVNSRGWSVQETFEQMADLDRKYTQEEQNYEQPSPDSDKTCGACRWFLRQEEGAIGSCQVVGGAIAWFGTCDLYINASAEAIAAFAVHPDDDEDGEMETYTRGELEKIERELVERFGLDKQEGGEGIKFVIGRLKGETKTTLQSILFDKDIWTLAKAKAWLKENDFKSSKLDETEDNFRFRQRDPGDFKPRSFRTITPGKQYGGPSDDDEKKTAKTITLPIVKVSPDGKFVVAPILVPETVDLEGDIISREEIEKAAHDFMEFFQNVGLMHEKILTTKDAVIVESSILRGDITINGHKLKKGTWIGAFKIHNEKLRDAIKSGKLKGVSIGGVGTRNDI